MNSLGKDGARLNGKPGGLSTSTINNYYNAFNSVLKFAERMTWITKNPADNVSPPTEKNKNAKIYDSVELTRFLEGLDKIKIDHKHKTLLYIALSSSARQSEIVALEEKHCDFDKCGIHIHQALTVKKGESVMIKEFEKVIVLNHLI